MNTPKKKSLQTTSELTSHFIKIKGANMHYYDVGSGDPILFLHSIPMSAYSWRHVVKQLSPHARCIAPDLIGMGQSDKPDIDYRVFDHIAYIDAFIDALKLKNITLVLHGWGSVIGFDYARRHEKNIKAIAFYESHVQPVTKWDQLSLPVQQFASMLRQSKASHNAIVEHNYLIEKLLPRCVIRALTDEEMMHYRAPFLTPESRKPLWQYMQDFPIGDGPKDVVQLMQKYSTWLQKTKIPKLLLYAMPGFMTPMETVAWSKTHLPNIELACLDDALHLAQESVPKPFSEALMRWYKTV